jgi:hypothetical protein
VIDFLEAAIRIATPLMFAALGGILSERAGVFAGLEGMMLMGAFGGAIGAWASGSALVGVALAILCGAAIGLVVAMIAHVGQRAGDALMRAADSGAAGVDTTTEVPGFSQTRATAFLRRPVA